ncbi:MAG: T9SS type A sorting domain-containing protein, partial [Bacteroidota bacterium]
PTANTGYSIGDYGTILKTVNGGTTWVTLSSGTTYPLYSVFFTNKNTGYVVGYLGTILKTTNGGESVPNDTLIQNIEIPNGETNCYNASQTITVAGNETTFTVQNGGSATMIAGQNILYLPNTTVQSGGYMWGYIAPSGPYCVNPSIPVVVNEEKIIEATKSVSKEQSSIKIYPNPTTGNFILELPLDIQTEKVQVEVYGIWGKKVLTTTLNGERKHEFSLSDKPTGVYFIRLVSGDKTETLKIIKQ